MALGDQSGSWELGSNVSEVGLNEVMGVAENMLQGKVRGCMLVDVNR